MQSIDCRLQITDHRLQITYFNRELPRKNGVNANSHELIFQQLNNFVTQQINDSTNQQIAAYRSPITDYRLQITDFNRELPRKNGVNANSHELIFQQLNNFVTQQINDSTNQQIAAYRSQITDYRSPISTANYANYFFRINT